LYGTISSSIDIEKKIKINPPRSALYRDIHHRHLHAPSIESLYSDGLASIVEHKQVSLVKDCNDRINPGCDDGSSSSSKTFNNRVINLQRKVIIAESMLR